MGSLSRSQAAELLGIGLRRLRDLETAKRLVPQGKKGEQRSYSEAQIARYLIQNPKEKRQPKSKQRRTSTDGLTAAAVFSLLETNTPRIRIVIELNVHPDVVDELAMRHARMKREEGSLPPPPCVKCGESAARFCGGCLPSQH